MLPGQRPARVLPGQGPANQGLPSQELTPRWNKENC